MEHYSPEFTRRSFLRGLLIGAASLTAVKAFSEEALRFIEEGGFLDELIRTPQQIEGPFYPTKLPLDVDNDLILVKPSTTPAIGKITHLSGRVLDLKGEPLKGLTVEIWQVDGNGVYLHQGRTTATSETRTFKASAASKPHPTGHSGSGPSSRSPIRGGRHTSTSRSRRATASCSRPSFMSKATPPTRGTAS